MRQIKLCGFLTYFWFDQNIDKLFVNLLNKYSHKSYMICLLFLSKSNSILCYHNNLVEDFIEMYRFSINLIENVILVERTAWILMLTGWTILLIEILTFRKLWSTRQYSVLKLITYLCNLCSIDYENRNYYRCSNINSFGFIIIGMQ